MKVGLHRDYNAARFKLELLGQGRLGPLYFTLRLGHLRFFFNWGANMNAHGNPDRAPIPQSSLYGHFDMARLLLDNGVDMNIQQNNLQRP